MKSEKEVLPKLQNIRWKGKYNLYCDVSVGGGTTLGVKVEGHPTAASDNVWLPPNHRLREQEAAKVEEAVLAYYYDVNIEEGGGMKDPFDP